MTQGGIEKKIHRKAAFGNVDLENDFTEDDMAGCFNKLESHMAAGADGIVNELTKVNCNGVVQVIVNQRNWV